MANKPNERPPVRSLGRRPVGGAVGGAQQAPNRQAGNRQAPSGQSTGRKLSYAERRKIVRRRQLMGLIVLALLVWGIWAGVSAIAGWFGSMTGGAAANPSSSATALASGEVAACTAANVEVQAFAGDGSSPKTVFAAKDKPMLWFSVTNNGPQPCTINLGAKEQIFTITSGAETIWTSAHCNRDGLTDLPMTIASGEQKISTPSAWFKVRSTVSGGCGEDQASVITGGASYHLKVSVGGFESNDLQFILN